MSDFLLELRSEEIPARMQAGARADLEKLFRKEMDAAGVAVGEVTVWSTPRRLALIARNLPLATAAVSEEVKGPRVGAPPQALEGFLRKTGLTEDQLTERDGVLFAISEKPGRATADVLAEAIPAIIRAFPWPKSMRWGAPSISTESTRWVRPLSGIVALLGEDLVACEAGGVTSGCATKGHRFHHPDDITIGSVSDYQDKLRACHVIVDHSERQDMIRTRASAAAQAAGLTLVEDEGLVIENAGLTEFPVPLLGRFDEAFLEVPPEVIQLTARTNQKYFICRDAAGKLANAFVCTANIAASDGGEAIVAGNRKVLAARLSDARFFWQQDRKTTLEEQAKKLSRITFHEKLGTVADKVERVAKLAEWLASEGIVPNCDPKLARQAAELCKADLVTEMVGEFPELQGLMGGYYARAEGLPDAVADAIADHYKPVGQGDDVPTAPVTVAVALADKLDSVGQFFSEGLKPTGSKDPFALRRAALGIISIARNNDLRLSIIFAVLQNLVGDKPAEIVKAGQDRKASVLSAVLDELGPQAAMGTLKGWVPELKNFSLEKQVREAVGKVMLSALPVATQVRDFLFERLEVAERDIGTPVDLIRAGVKYDGGTEDDLVRLLARVHALQAFVGTEDGTNLLSGYKRAANILKKEGFSLDRHPGLDPGSRLLAGAAEGSGMPDQVRHDVDGNGAISLSYTPETAEKTLIDALAEAGPRAAAAVEAEDFASAMAALASLRAPIDAFFDEVTVNDADPAKRSVRLATLAQFRDAVHRVADFSKIEG